MKSFFALYVLLALSVVSMSAQTEKVIKLKDGHVRTFLVQDILEVSFEEQKNMLYGHEYVDLGLESGTMWATCNIGADKPEDNGLFFSWGETEGSLGNERVHNKWIDENFKAIKYNCDPEKGVADYKTGLDIEDDAADANWGHGWRTPSIAEFLELYQCEHVITTLNGVEGISYTGPNGNSIFFPFKYENGNSDDINEILANPPKDLLWTRCADKCYFPDGSTPFGFPFNRHARLHIRPVIVLRNYDVDKDKNAMDEGAGRMFIKLRNGRTETFLMNDIEDMYYDIDAVPNYAEVHEYVDLGLPSGLKWAAYNVGATKPEEVGDYYGWGSTQPRYPGVDYRYNYPDPKANITDNPHYLAPEYDVATSEWGDNWRMPTMYELRELEFTCEREYTEVNGIKGMKFTGPNGNSVFLPAGGYVSNKGKLTLYNQDGQYNLSLAYNAAAQTGWQVYFNERGFQYGHAVFASQGANVRPVYDRRSVKVRDVQIKFNSDYLYLDEGETANVPVQVVPNMLPAGALEWFSEDEEVAYVHDGVVTAKKGGFTRIGVRSGTYGLTAYCDVIVRGDALDLSKQYVDLGLPSGTLWAKTNLGEKNVLDCKVGYNWGYTTTDWVSTQDYKWYKPGTRELNYNGDVLAPEDDAATANWGSDWRMPTKEEMQELIDCCTVSYTKVNNEGKYDFYGYIIKFQGPNGNSIYIPINTLFGSNMLDVWTGSKSYGMSFMVNSFGDVFIEVKETPYLDNRHVIRPVRTNK